MFFLIEYALQTPVLPSTTGSTHLFPCGMLPVPGDDTDGPRMIGHRQSAAFHVVTVPIVLTVISPFAGAQFVAAHNA